MIAACACCTPEGRYSPGRRAFLATAASFVVARDAAAEERDACGSPGVRIEVVGEKRDPVYDLSQTRASLRALQASPLAPESARSNHGASVVGMTLCRFRTTQEVRVFESTVGGRRCVVPSLVRVVFSQVEHSILVASDGTEPGSCQRNVVIDHERRHAAINDGTIGQGRMRVDFALRRIRPRLGPVWDRRFGADEAAAAFLAKLKPIIDEAITQVMEVNARDNAAMDTPQAYRRDWSRCGGVPS